MLELPEVLTMSEQLNSHIIGKKVIEVLPPSKQHKFCWYNGEPEDYDAMLKGSKIELVEGFGIFVEIVFDNKMRLCFNDGVNVRLTSCDKLPKDYQLLINLDDDSALVFTVAMYGGIIAHNGSYENEYYEASRKAISPFSNEFKAYYEKMLAESKANLTAKAFLATNQRFPGVGNGVSQDILFEAGIHPKRKVNTLSLEEKEKLLDSMIEVLQCMTDQGGRDTEKNLFGEKGGYKVKMSKNTVKLPCSKCGGQVIKETYLGGSIYYCSTCQKLDLK